MSVNLFKKKLRPAAEPSSFDNLVAAVRDGLDTTRTGLAKPADLTRMIGLESLNDTQVGELQHALDTLNTNFGTIATAQATTLGATSKFALEHLSERVGAAATAALIAGDPMAFVRQDVSVENIAINPKTDTFVGVNGMSDGFKTRINAFEDYEEKDNRNVVVNTVTYNLAVSRQSPFGEAYFPTVTVSPDNLGVAVSIRLVSVFEDFKHNISGALADLKKKNIVKALIDSTILKNEQTRIIPVHRTESAALFATGFTATNLDLEGESIPTAPLAIGKEINLLGISQTAALLANGVLDRTDSIDPAVSLENVYVKFGNDDILRFNVGGIALANFVAPSQDNYRRQNLNFHTDSISINKDRKTFAGAALTDLAGVVTGNLSVQLRLALSGHVNIETGDLLVTPVQLKVLAIVDLDTKQKLSLTTGVGQTIANLVAAAQVLGYDPLAYRTNSNRRQRGQLLDTTYYNQIWAVPLRAPISVLRPVNFDAQTDSSDLAALVSATHVRTSNEAVTTLIKTAAQLAEYTANSIPGQNVAPDLFGVARMLLDPTYIEESLNVRTTVNTLTSHEKSRDLQAALVDKIRNIGYRLYRDSGFQAVVESQAAGVSGNPTLIIGTDPLTARYLLVDGEPRLGGEGFEHQIVTSPDKRLEGKIFIALGYPGKDGGSLNPLHFGNMLWSPELVLVLPISRNGQVSKELTVQPRFRHIVNVPILGLLTVEGINELVQERTPIAFDEV